jgi:hypothetical protein
MSNVSKASSSRQKRVNQVSSQVVTLPPIAEKSGRKSRSRERNQPPLSPIDAHQLFWNYDEQNKNKLITIEQQDNN